MIANLASCKLVYLLNYFDKIKLTLIDFSILIAPPGVKDMEYDEDTYIGQHFSEDWTFYNVGLPLERTQSIPGNLCAQCG